MLAKQLIFEIEPYPDDQAKLQEKIDQMKLESKHKKEEKLSDDSGSDKSDNEEK